MRKLTRVAAESWQPHQLIFANDIAHDCVGSLQLSLGLRGNFNDFFARADFESGIVGVGLGYIDFDIRKRRGGKTGFGDLQRVRTGRHVRESVFTRTRGCCGLRFIRGGIQQLDGGIRDDGATLVDDRPQHDSGI